VVPMSVATMTRERGFAGELAAEGAAVDMVLGAPGGSRSATLSACARDHNQVTDWLQVLISRVGAGPSPTTSAARTPAARDDR
jgi:hypothetical protein